MNLKDEITNKSNLKEKMWAILIDPDKTPFSTLPTLIQSINSCSCNYIFIGGSQIFNVNFHDYVSKIKSLSTKKIIIFPGDNTQISSSADGILLLSLISGRNPDLLIGKHVQSSYELKKAAISLLATGYILIEGGVQSSVQYISNTNPIPKNKYNIAAATALAGEQLGLHLIYADAGSGALNPLSKKMISSIKKQLSIPLIIGGGITCYNDIENAWIAGADIVVIGNAIEKNKKLIELLNKRMKCN
jgi:phosphoglycerol geranylgeranyltransferase